MHPSFVLEASPSFAYKKNAHFWLPRIASVLSAHLVFEADRGTSKLSEAGLAANRDASQVAI